MPFDPVLAAIRFGCGLSPVIAPPQSVEEMLGALAGPDRMALAWPIPTPMTVHPSEAEWQVVLRERRAANRQEDPARAEAALTRFETMRLAMRQARRTHFASTLCRAIQTTDGVREALTRFWADHFTVKARGGTTVHLVTPFVEEAIRPHVTGRFTDMLKAVVQSPMMLAYLDQVRSVGPNSPAARGQGKGLNENLARELMELHTLGVGGPYDQTDVRQLAELLTGLNYRADQGFVFLLRQAEPGSETVLGVTYGEDATLANVMTALDDLARHPSTADHIARKLVVHFVSDDPDPDLVAALAAVFLDSGGDLQAVSAVLLNHPAAWLPERRNVKLPIDFISSALRALALAPDRLFALTERDNRRLFDLPLRVMGQDWERPNGPDGWPEEDTAWITPQGVAGRITWAMTAPLALIPDLPDPRDFALTALGPDVPEAVVLAASRAEDRKTGIGVVLASAAFQRR